MEDQEADTLNDASYHSGSSQSQSTKRDEHSRSSGESKTTLSNNSNSQDVASREDFAIAKAENQAVFRIRLAVAFFLTLCTIGVAILVYLHTKNQEEEELENALYEFSTKIFGSLGTTTDQALAGIDAFIVSAVSFARASNATWPFVTIPNVGTRLSKLLSVTGASVVSIAIHVPLEQAEEWNNYSASNGQAWVEESLSVQKNDPGFTGSHLQQYEFSDLWALEQDLMDNADEYFPQWQTYPLASTIYYPYNFEMQTSTERFDILRSGKVKLTGVVNSNFTDGDVYNTYFPAFIGDAFDGTEPVTETHYPIFEEAADNVLISDTLNESAKLLGFMWAPFHWRRHMLNMLPSGVDGLVLVTDNTCNPDTSFTYEINGPDVTFLGWGDHHDYKYDNLMLEAPLLETGQYATGSSAFTGLPLSTDECAYSFRVYPSKKFENEYVTSNPWVYTSVTVAIFVFTSAVFYFYDTLVERRQKKVMLTAVKSSAIVSSLFPSNVRDRLYEMEGKEAHPLHSSQKNRLRSFIRDTSQDEYAANARNAEESVTKSKPIADLFPEATVMFGDIASFTAWSSTREPSQVFILLESLYGAFDSLASKRGIFKVETIGDCYVAVAGLPDPRRDHAVVIAKFASDCCKQMAKLVARLSVTLGPDTEDLTMRFGLNSGPVTAGVLRGQKSRFQLFGDTVNTAARMESTGAKNRIHVSQSTADELIKHKKGHWLHTREDAVAIKGKGLMTTYWVNPRESSEPSEGKSRDDMDTFENIPIYELRNSSSKNESKERIGRLVDWNTDILSRLIRAIVAHRTNAQAGKQDKEGPVNDWSPRMSVRGTIPIDEVQEIVALPDFIPNQPITTADSVELGEVVTGQLRAYVASIAATYHGSNPFHNFEHASHVCMSVTKLMSRIVAADEFFEQDKQASSIEEFKFKQTFGIASDPLTLFSCGFAALIHDADHPGVPNTQILKEGSPVAQKYGNRSIAEQRSVDIAWELLMEDRFKDLRLTICPAPAELQRFRQLLVNSVLATDIMDKELKQLRNDRWDKAFAASPNPELANARDTVNRKATIVIEHLIQASDVAHTMQHWHVFRKWNERLFLEMFQAYEAGRAEKNPAEFWYKGELGFFDYYILPLAKKLSDCGVFGVSSDEYLNYALKNREEWELKGEKVVADMVEKVRASKP